MRKEGQGHGDLDPPSRKEEEDLNYIIPTRHSLFSNLPYINGCHWPLAGEHKSFAL